MNIAINIARCLSFIFHPLIVPVYCIALALFTTHLYTLPLQTRLNVLLYVFGLTVCLPLTVIYILYAVKAIRDTSLNDRKERTWPYIAGLLCYVVLFFYLSAAHAPVWLLAFVMGGIIAVVIDLIVNLRWKISGHATAMGGAMALVFCIDYLGLNAFNIDFWIYFTVIMSGLVASGRLILERHTPAQIAVGYLNGLVVTILSILLIVNL